MQRKKTAGKNRMFKNQQGQGKALSLLVFVKIYKSMV